MEVTDLQRINKAQIQKAGPRYAPGVDPDAPNLPVESVLLPVAALTGDALFLTHVEGLRRDLLANLGWQTSQASKYFKGVKSTPDSVADALRDLASSAPGKRLASRHLVYRRSSRAQARLGRLAESLLERERKGLDEGERSQIRTERSELLTLSGSLDAVVEFTESPAFSAIASNCLLIQGEWGTGKTHLLCDVTRDRTARGLPTLLYLAKELPRNTDPLQALCHATGLAASISELLHGLQKLGEQSGATSLLVIDGINEGDRSKWRAATARLAKLVKDLTHVGVILSCRQPFDRQIFSAQTRRQWVKVSHPGFVDAEFDAQLEFFSHYDIPAPDIPLLTPEFSRPLFLRLMCETIGELSKGKKRVYLRGIASGQKAMTKILEDFVKKLGVAIEDGFALQRGWCWDFLKGNTVGDDLVGVAPLMAEAGRDSLARAECLHAIALATGWANEDRCGELLDQLVVEGLLLEHLSFDGREYTEELQLPYQRFSDHLIARHLLERHLDTTSEATIRRSFHANRPLGRIFKVCWGYTFAQPGLAEAIMVEFPERVKRVRLPDHARELVFCLPKKRRLSEPLKEVFLEGLYWRPTESFSSGTDHVISVYLNPTGAEAEAFEVITALSTRPDHPWSPAGLTCYLAQRTIADRDLTWSEYLRRASPDSVVYRLIEWVERNSGSLTHDSAMRCAALLSLLLTTTRRDLRDRATRCLFHIGGRYPSILFDRALAVLDFPDPYVPERVLAACYGIAMGYWADPGGEHLRGAIPQFAFDLYMSMFAPPAKHSTAHVLMQDYALGVIDVALRLAPQTLSKEQLTHIERPLKHVPSPFPEADAISEDDLALVTSAFRMDFENYTLGDLVEGRSNYDYGHEDYRAIRRQIGWRVGELGYSDQRFAVVDRFIHKASMHARGERARVERYGKKYSWIAFFEMYGLRLSRGLLPSWNDQDRPSQADIDPSFPLQPRDWLPELDDPLSRGPEDVVGWVSHGPRPDYENILELDRIDGILGPWILLDGYIEKRKEDDNRSLFTFLRCILANPSELQQLLREYDRWAYPGNHAIPDPICYSNTFAGEIPWSARFAYPLCARGGASERQVVRAFASHGSHPKAGVPAELPVAQFLWESSADSSVNDVLTATVPSPALCERLGLVNHARQFDLYDHYGGLASICIFRSQDQIRARFVYIRKDLMNRYTTETAQDLAWLVWGERTPHPGAPTKLIDGIPRSVYSSYAHIHKQSYLRPLGNSTSTPRRVAGGAGPSVGARRSAHLRAGSGHRA